MRGKPSLTPSQISHIRRLHVGVHKVSVNELARRYGVSRDVIDNVITGHIPYVPTQMGRAK